MEFLPAIKPGWVFIHHREVKVGKIIHHLRGDGHETGIEDRRVGVLVKKRVADIRKGRLRDCVVLLLEEESDDVAGFSVQIVGLERNLVWSRATDGDLEDRGSGDRNKDEGVRSETRYEHYV